MPLILLFQQVPELVGETMGISDTQYSVITVMTLLLFIGAMGKSAQIPLHVWLPESMEGPTPISALIHAATMVTAGVYMVARLSPLSEFSQVALSVVLIFGATGALFLGMLALVENDIKRVIAYSTMSQLGYMMAANGVSALAATNALSGTTSYGVSGLLASAVRVYGGTVLANGTNSAAYSIESLYPGAGYNGGSKTDGSVSGNSITVNGLGSQNFSIVVNENGTAQESFKVSFVGSGAFVEDVINTGLTAAVSEIIKGNLVKDEVDATASKLTDFSNQLNSLFGDTGFTISTKFLNPTTNPTGTGTAAISTMISDNGGRFYKLVQNAGTNMTGGTNGVPASEDDRATALIGTAASEPKTGMQAFDDPVLNIGIALAPDIKTESVQNALITLAETTQNFLALVSPPYGLTTQEAIDWSNGKSSSTGNSRTSPINSSYAAIHWPYVKMFSVFDGKDRWYDPSIFAARQMAFTDSVAASWFAPAGFQRGRLTKPTEVEVKLNQGDRDTLYSGGNVINPIVAFPQQGITIFGQRTTQRSPTALDRINVRRLMIYIRKIILLATQRFVFEPNDEFTWAQIESVVNPFLDDIRRQRGITEFRVICDETVNTPVRVDRNELWTKVLIKPTKTAEILIFELNLTNQSAQLGS